MIGSGLFDVGWHNVVDVIGARFVTLPRLKFPESRQYNCFMEFNNKKLISVWNHVLALLSSFYVGFASLIWESDRFKSLEVFTMYPLTPLHPCKFFQLSFILQSISYNAAKIRMVLSAGF